MTASAVSSDSIKEVISLQPRTRRKRFSAASSREADQRKRMSLPLQRFTRFVSAGVVNRAFCEVGALQTLAERLGQAQPMYGQRFFQTLAQGCAADGLISSSHSTVSSSLGLSYSFIACAAPSSHEPPALPGSRGTSILLIGVYFGLQTDGAFLKTQPTL